MFQWFICPWWSLAGPLRMGPLPNGLFMAYTWRLRTAYDTWDVSSKNPVWHFEIFWRFFQTSTSIPQLHHLYLGPCLDPGAFLILRISTVMGRLNLLGVEHDSKARWAPINSLINVGNWSYFHPTYRSYFTPVITSRGPPKVPFVPSDVKISPKDSNKWLRFTVFWISDPKNVFLVVTGILWWSCFTKKRIVHSQKTMNWPKIFQYTVIYPWNIPQDPLPTVYEGIPFIWGCGDSWGMLHGYVEVLFELSQMTLIYNLYHSHHRFQAYLL